MESVHGSCSKASKFVAEGDVISSLPEAVITSILDRLPIRDAIRTGILAKNWRFKWTMLSQLVFDEKFFKDLLGAQGTSSYDWRNVIIKFLHLIKGSITKFTLCLPKDKVFDVEDINDWFLFLSGKGIQDVTLNYMHQTPPKLPGYLFSCLELRSLEIRNCNFCPPLSFRGFPKLLNLNLNWVRFESYKFGELVTCSPLLEILKICGLSRKATPVEMMTKLENLKVLTLALANLDTRTLTSSGIFQLVGSFSKLQKVSLGFLGCKLLAEAGARKDVTTTFPCVKTLILRDIDCSKDIEVSLVLKMISCSPKLQTLKILGTIKYDVPPFALCSSDLDDNTMWQSKLQSVVFALCSKVSKSEVYLIKSLLACSPLLKKIAIGLNSSLEISGADGRLEFAEKLLKLHRASPVSEIDLFYFSNWDSVYSLVM